MTEGFDINDLEDLDEDIYNVVELTVDKGQAPLRIDKYIFQSSTITSRTKIQDAAKAGQLLVNKKAVKANYKVRPLDEILMVYPKSLHVPDLTPQNIPLDIIYEDESLLVVNKPAGMVVHPGVKNVNGTLVNALLYHVQNLPGEAEERAGLVHRIDKNTSGLLVVAKTDQAMSHLAKQFFNRTIQRRYVALVWGDVQEDEGTITGNIGRDKRDNILYTVYPRGDFGKHAITHYKVLDRFLYTTLVECKLETGRTHQIRVHMKHIGHTLFQDDRYGGDKILSGTIYTKYKQFVENAFALCPRQALHARSLGFEHPVSGELMHFESELPHDMQAVIDKWRNYCNNLNN